jgi:hypothetical protein
METQIKLLNEIDLSDCALELSFPNIEAEIRRVASAFVKGVLESNVRLEVQPIDETGKLYAVLWINLSANGWDNPVVEIPVDALFDEYLKKKEK